MVVLVLANDLSSEIAAGIRDSWPGIVMSLFGYIASHFDIFNTSGATELDSLAVLLGALESFLLPIADIAGNEHTLLEAATDVFAVEGLGLSCILFVLEGSVFQSSLHHLYRELVSRAASTVVVHGNLLLRHRVVGVFVGPSSAATASLRVLVNPGVECCLVNVFFSDILGIGQL